MGDFDGALHVSNRHNPHLFTAQGRLEEQNHVRVVVDDQNRVGALRRVREQRGRPELGLGALAGGLPGQLDDLALRRCEHLGRCAPDGRQLTRHVEQPIDLVVVAIGIVMEERQPLDAREHRVVHGALHRRVPPSGSLGKLVE